MKNQKGFALVLSLVLLVVMSLMGGALIVISSGDHQTNNTSDNYQQTFYVAETALLEGEKLLVNFYLGGWEEKSACCKGERNKQNKGIPPEHPEVFDGENLMKNANYTKSKHKNEDWYIDTGKKCFNSFSSLKKDNLKIIHAVSANFGLLLDNSITTTKPDEIKQINNLKNYYYEYFIVKGGSASFSGAGSSIKKSATDSNNQGISFKIYGCGIYGREDRMIVALESSVVLPRQ